MTSVSVTWLGIRIPHTEEKQFRGGKEPGLHFTELEISLLIEKAREFQKNIYFCFIDYAKAFYCMGHNKLWKISESDGNTRPPDLPFEKPVCRFGSNS